MTLIGKAALVTGGRRIGAVVARALGARGMDVAVSYHRSRRRPARWSRMSNARAVARSLSPRTCLTPARVARL